ncbi:MAG: DMT family transporter [Rhizobiales bacterium]|nr:DMT family transporter [Hyphomicrobiales bacterium]
MAFHLWAADRAGGDSNPGMASPATGYLLGALCWLLSANVYIAVKWVIDDLPPFSLALSRAFLAALVLLPFVSSYRAAMLKLFRNRWIELLVIGGSGLFLTQGLIFLGLLYTDVINCGLIISLMPIITMVLAFFVLGEPMGGWQAVGAAISFIGMIVIIVHGELSQLLALNFNIGELWVLLGALGFGLYTVLLRRAKFTMDRLPLLVMLLLCGSAVGIPFAVAELMMGDKFTMDMRGALALGYCAIFGGAIMYLLFNWSIEILGAAKAGLLMYLQMLFVPFFAYLLLGEKLQPYHFVGGALILLGIVVIVAKATKPATS